MSDYAKTVKALNELRDARLIGDYAIGGAVGAIIHSEPFYTEDFAVFACIPASGELLLLGPIYDFMRVRGFVPEREWLVAGSVKLQLLPAASPLEKEAVAEAVEIALYGVPTRVMRAEHLIGLALATGRPKDFLRIEQLQRTSKGPIDADRLRDLIDRHGLNGRWDELQRRLGGA